jgi:acetyl-CoA carboxylase carboxyltransferase component
MVRTYIGIHDEKPVGVFINPPGHSGNMINSRALDKYMAALQFFKVLGLPIVSFLDTSGAEPRASGKEAHLLGKFIKVAGEIINYPHSKMGFITGRCFGGATILAFPKNLGGKYAYAIEGSRMGVMHDDIITKLLSGSARLLEKWQTIVATQTADMRDLKEKGSIDDVIKHEHIAMKISIFLVAPNDENLPMDAMTKQILNLKKSEAV